MPTRFCDHLDEYGAQYVQTEAAYQQCVNLFEKMINDGPETDLTDLVTAAVAEWTDHDAKLRDMLVAEVEAGRVRVPQALVRLHRKLPQATTRKPHHPGRMVCATCRFVLPRLDYPDWQIAHNGVIAFKGQELSVPVGV